MPSRPLLAATLSLLLLSLGCSKTEDVAPEKKIFGDPPTIESVNFDVQDQFHFICNFTEIAVRRFCSETGVTDLQADPLGVVIEGTYTRLFVTARVTDRNTTLNPDGSINRSDLLLVSASFTERDRPKPKPETTLVLFDDGSENTFPQNQKKDGVGEECIVDEATGKCSCSGKIYQLTSNDMTKNDSTFTRGFAFIGQGTNPFLQDCIMKEEHEAPFPVAPGTVFEFRIDAVDKAGNLATWGDRPTVRSGQDSFLCTGDECGCCLLTSSNPAVECKGKPGMPSVDYPAGICVSLF